MLGDAKRDRVYGETALLDILEWISSKSQPVSKPAANR
jgi:hypothetical protein